MKWTSASLLVVAGTAALLRQKHPGWSVSEIKSAIMTTGGPVLAADGTVDPEIFGYGAGQLNPNVKWTKDRGNEPQRDKAEYPWFWAGDKPNTERVNDVHLTTGALEVRRGDARILRRHADRNDRLSRPSFDFIGHLDRAQGRATDEDSIRIRLIDRARKITDEIGRNANDLRIEP